MKLKFEAPSVSREQVKSIREAVSRSLGLMPGSLVDDFSLQCFLADQICLKAGYSQPLQRTTVRGGDAFFSHFEIFQTLLGFRLHLFSSPLGELHLEIINGELRFEFRGDEEVGKRVSNSLLEILSKFGSTNG